MLVLFGAFVLMTISNIPFSASDDSYEDMNESKIKYGSIRFTTMKDGNCRGLLFTKEWVVVDSKCVENSTKFHVTRIAGKPESIDGDFEEGHFTEDPADPNKHYFELLKATQHITEEEFNYLPVIGQPTWENVRKTAEAYCSNEQYKDIIDKIISKETRVPQKICSQKFGK